MSGFLIFLGLFGVLVCAAQSVIERFMPGARHRVDGHADMIIIGAGSLCLVVAAAVWRFLL